MYRDKGEDKEKLKQWLYFLENPESKEVASFMKEKGLSLDLIAEITKLKKEEIQNL